MPVKITKSCAIPAEPTISSVRAEVSVPMSIAGALIFLRAGFASLNIYTQVGLITLAGLISNHGTRIGTILTQFVVPAIYMLLARTRQGEAEPVTA